MKSTVPAETLKDDILKRAIKRALKQKGIDLDACKARFASKNMLFNFKSVIRGNTRLSMLLFDRGAEALSLKYTILLEEAGGEIVGKELTEPIAISSDELYDRSLTGADEEFYDMTEPDSEIESFTEEEE